MKKLIVILSLGVMLAGCDPRDLPPASVADICVALLGPVKYNSANPKSRRFAADLLALDLKERNQVGQQLNCPQYKTR